jgi:hypothetical protein
MNFFLGPPPPSPSFRPGQSGWSRLEEPSMNVWMWLIATPVSLIFGVLFYLFANRWFGFDIDEFLDLQWDWIFPIAFALIVVHERIHALIHPGWGRSSFTQYGFSPKSCAFYAVYDGPMTRGRLLSVLIAPFLALSVMPILIALIYRPVTQFVTFAAIMNAVFSGSDICALISIKFGIPVGAIVRNNGWQTYWKQEPQIRT